MDKELVKALDAYEKKFGEGYPLYWVDTKLHDTIADIRQCVSEGRIKEIEIPDDGNLY